MTSKDNSGAKFIWKWEYSLVLALNAFYIFLFYFLMTSNI